MKRYVFLVLLLCLSTIALARQQDKEIKLVSEALVSMIDTSQPLFVEVRAGEWSSRLETEIRKALLLRGADLRENLPRPLYEINEETTGATDNLSAYDLVTANLVQINMDIDWETIEERRVFSYQSTRVPVYKFEVKTILLPNYRLLSLASYVHVSKDSPRIQSTNHRLKWFDPVIATAALGSLIYLLWTTE